MVTLFLLVMKDFSVKQVLCSCCVVSHHTGSGMSDMSTHQTGLFRKTILGKCIPGAWLSWFSAFIFTVFGFANIFINESGLA